MKMTIFTTLILTSTPALLSAAETVGEKVEEKANDAKRATKRGMNRVEEKICEATDKNCLDEKLKNRAEETKDIIKDKAKEGKNVLDND